MKKILLLCLLLTAYCVMMVAQTFTVEPIPDAVFARMKGKSFAKDCTVKRSDLRYLRLSHWNMEDKAVVGEMVCNKAIAKDVTEIFRALYEAHYVIERMQLIDDYDADDEKSMAANNTSCFNFRFMTGSTTRVSLHGKGMAIDINPLYNPYVKGRTVSPKAGMPYAYRRSGNKLFIKHGDVCHKLFLKHGFRWGGAWRNHKDYQHFEK